MPPPIVPAARLAPTEARRRWAALLQQIFEVDPLACPRCRGPMRVVACITQPSVIDRILTHLRTRAATAAHPGARESPLNRRPDGPRGAPAGWMARRRPSGGRIKHVGDERIKEVLTTMTSSRQACETLVKEALDNGGSDSVTVIIGRAVTPSGE